MRNFACKNLLENVAQRSDCLAYPYLRGCAPAILKHLEKRRNYPADKWLVLSDSWLRAKPATSSTSGHEA